MKACLRERKLFSTGIAGIVALIKSSEPSPARFKSVPVALSCGEGNGEEFRREVLDPQPITTDAASITQTKLGLLVLDFSMPSLTRHFSAAPSLEAFVCCFPQYSSKTARPSETA